jgi:tetratricopeptide (TPR) repeat protein
MPGAAPVEAPDAPSVAPAAPAAAAPASVAASPSAAVPPGALAAAAPAVEPALVAAASAPSNPAEVVVAPEPPRPSFDSPWIGRKLAAFAAAPAPDASLAEARAALDRRDYAGAVKLLEALPRAPAVDAALGRAFFELGRDDAALAALRRARAAEPGHAEALLVLGTVLESRRDRAGAREAFRAYLAHHPQGEHAAEVRAVLAGL